MRLQNFLQGLHILAQYTDSGTDSYPLSAEHDTFSFITDSALPDDDDAKIRALGWFRDNDAEGENGELITDNESNVQCWQAFV